MDVPDSSNHWEDIQQRPFPMRMGLGMDYQAVNLAISAVAGEGVTALLCRLRTMLDKNHKQ